MKHFVDWYIDHRQVAYGDFGGGISDDVDLLNTWPGVALMGCDPDKLKLSLHRLLEAAIKNGMFTNGLCTIQADELHGYEEGIDCLSANLILDYGNPTQLERAMVTERGIERITGINAAGHRHFRTSYYNGKKMATEDPWGYAKAYSYLVLQPGQLLVDYDGNPAGEESPARTGRRPAGPPRIGRQRPLCPADRDPFRGRQGRPCHARLFPVARVLGRLAVDRRPQIPRPDPRRRRQRAHGRQRQRARLARRARRPRPAHPRRRTRPAARHAAERRPRQRPLQRLPLHRQRPLSLAAHRRQTLPRAASTPRKSRNATCSTTSTPRAACGSTAWACPTPSCSAPGSAASRLLRNALYPGHTVSWRFAAPANDQSVAILIPDATPTSFKVIAYNLETIPVHATMTGWNIDPGVWEITQGLDTNNDDVADQALESHTAPFERSRSLDLTFAPRATTVLTFKLKTPGVPYWQRPDLGISRDDITIGMDALLVKVHSLGSVPTPETPIVFRTADGSIVASSVIPPLPAPVDLFPGPPTSPSSCRAEPKPPAAPWSSIRTDSCWRSPPSTTRWVCSGAPAPRHFVRCRSAASSARGWNRTSRMAPLNQ